MAKDKVQFVCQKCGYKTPKWLGRCLNCQAWDSFIEETIEKNIKSKKILQQIKIISLKDVQDEYLQRLSTNISELDRVLGGGLTAGAVILLAGEPGVGKSTLTLQCAEGISLNKKKLIYINGEESAGQVRLRAERLNLNLNNIWLMPETSVNQIEDYLENHPWDALVVDSIQTLTLDELTSPAGSPAQLKESAYRLSQLAKKHAKPVILVGHITKEGSIAGPKLLEHLVDTVLYFEGDPEHSLRLLRAFKNRFGSANEIGVFEMTDTGLGEVKNPSALFLAERPANASGSVVTAVMEGQRAILLEVQALVSNSPLAIPRRQALGIDNARLNLLAAVLEKKVKLKLYDRDIFVNVASGARIQEPAADLAIIVAIASSWADKVAPAETIFIGEVGLAGEVRHVNRLEMRLNEAYNMGFKNAIIPKIKQKKIKFKKLNLYEVESVTQLLKEHLNF